MATRKRSTKKAAPRRTNSSISDAQRESSAKRKARIAAEQAKREQGKQAPAQPLGPDGKPVPKLSQGNPTLTDPKLQAAKDSVSNRNRDTLSKSTLEQNTRPGDSSTFKGGSQAAAKIAGLATGIRQENQRTAAAHPAPANPLADASNYGTNNKARADRLTALMNAQNQAATKKLTSAGKAVWMGARMNRAKIRNSGPERMDVEGNGGNDYTLQAVGDDIRSTDELMSWLADEKTFNQIRDAAKKAGMDVQNYDDVSKLWQSVVQQAASTYSTTGKKVTPWALLQLRGKSMVNGKPQRKTGVSTTIEEIDPAEAKVFLKDSLSKMLGRDPRQDEIDDFISKAQTIARQNPLVQHYSQEVGFDGAPVQNSTEITSSSGGGSLSQTGGGAIGAKAQLAAEQAAENAPDYAQYQAAGVYAPWMFEALASPI